MTIHVRGRQASPAPTTDDRHLLEKTDEDEEFEAGVYLALMKVARATTAATRAALGSCLMLGTPYEKAPPEVQDAIREFLDEADL